MNATSTQLNAMRVIVDLIMECIDPDGTPAGHLYAALMSAGCTLDQFNALIDGMVASGLIERRGDVLLPVVK